MVGKNRTLFYGENRGRSNRMAGRIGSDCGDPPNRACQRGINAHRRFCPSRLPWSQVSTDKPKPKRRRARGATTVFGLLYKVVTTG